MKEKKAPKTPYQQRYDKGKAPAAPGPGAVYHFCFSQSSVAPGKSLSTFSFEENSECKEKKINFIKQNLNCSKNENL